MIPAEAVGAAAKAFIEHGTLLPALEAAAPYMQAEFEKRWKYDALDSINELGSDTTQFQRKTPHGDD